MRQKVVTYNVYKYHELDEKAKDKAMGIIAEWNTYHDWWDFIYDDARTIGLHITGFDLYIWKITGEIKNSIAEVCKAIKENHGKGAKTYKLAQAWSRRRDTEENVESFTNELLQCYLEMLKCDYEYLQSEEAIKETIDANEYEFHQNGDIFND